MSDPNPRMNRRASIGLIAAAAGAVGTRSVAAIPATATYDPSDPVTRVETYVKLRSRMDGQKTFMPYYATIFGKPEGKAAVPLFDVEGFSWSKATRLGEGKYRLDGVEAGYFIDPQTRKPLGKWTNPLNGLETSVKHYRSWAHQIAAPEGLSNPERQPLPPGAAFAQVMGGPTTFAGKVWMHEDLYGTFPNKPKNSFADPLEYFGPVLTGTSLATWSADLADVANPRLAFVPTMLSYQTLGSWRPFMRMGDAPGLISWRMFGVKQPTIQGVPKHLRERVLAEYPDFLTKESATEKKLIGT